MKKILFILLFAPLFLFGQFNPEDRPEIAPNDSLNIYTMHAGGVRKMGLDSLKNWVNIANPSPQTLSLNTFDLSISNGNTVDLSSIVGGGDTLRYKLPNDHVFFWILGGQSNMDGRILNSSGAAADMDEFAKAYMFQPSDSTFEKLNATAGNNITRNVSSSHGPEIYLAKYAEQFFPNDTIYMAKFAEGGTAINRHLKDAEFYDSLWVNTVKPAIETTIAANKIPVISFFWMQGETDANTLTNAQSYHLRLDSLIDVWRDSIHKNMPIHFGKIAASNTYKDSINDAFDSRQLLIDNIGIVNSANFSKQDGSHFDLAGLENLCKGYIYSMHQLNNFGVPLYNYPVKNLSTILDNSSVQGVFLGNQTDTTIDLTNSKIFRIDLGTGSTAINFTFSNATDGEKYTIAWFNNTNSRSVNFPNTFYCNDGSSEGNFAAQTSEAGVLNFYYDGNSSNYYISSSAPACVASYEAEYTTILDYMTLNGITQPSDSLKTLQNTLIKQLKSQGIWSLLDVMYVPASETQRAACINWKNPSGDSLAIGSTTFVAKEGFFGVTSGTAAVTSAHDLSAGTNYVSTSQGIVWYSADSTTVAAQRIIEETDNNDLIIQFNTDRTGFIRFPGDHSITLSEKPTGLFHLINEGAASTDKYLFRNGVELTPGFTTGGDAMPNSDLRFVEGGSSQSISFFAAGASLRDKASILNTVIQAYITGINLTPQ